LNFNGLDVKWKGHATVEVDDEDFTLVVDPYGDFCPEKADLVLVTHSDEGHLDREALDDICEDSSCLVVPESFKELELPCRDVEYVEEGEILDIYSIEIEPVPMYNSNHERGQGFGYRFEMAGTGFYVAGDTGLVKEANDLEGRVDVAFLPVDGVFTMDVSEAVQMAFRIKPELVVPYHYGQPFLAEDAVDLQSFKMEIEDRNMDCRILER